jgi:hypothetical protein
MFQMLSYPSAYISSVSVELPQPRLITFCPGSMYFSMMPEMASYGWYQSNASGAVPYRPSQNDALPY